ncbi:MAG: site-specific integrase [Bacteroides sp.]|nr:site-specific integrase [Bacteroides sp.]
MKMEKSTQTGKTYCVSKDATENPKLMAKELANGRDSLFLEYYLGCHTEVNELTGKEVLKKDRQREYLKLYVWRAPRTPDERQENKDTLLLAKKIRFERGQQMLEGTHGYRLKIKTESVNFLDWCRAYCDSYTKKDKRVISLSIDRFKDFLREKPEYERFSQRITPNMVTKEMMVKFADYLQQRSKGEGAHTLFLRFKKIVKNAVEKDLFAKNPCDGVVIRIDKNAIKKDILSQDEIMQMINTHYRNENGEIRRAFVFSLYTGLRFCDVNQLTFAAVDTANRMLRFDQSKTKGHSNASMVQIPLSDTILKLIGTPSDGDRGQTIFKLPSHTMCSKALRRWAKNAGIDKHITWHCARHSFAVNILNNGANIKTVASLLGHSGLQHTEKYTRAVDSLKQEAINSLPELPL